MKITFQDVQTQQNQFQEVTLQFVLWKSWCLEEAEEKATKKNVKDGKIFCIGR